MTFAQEPTRIVPTDLRNEMSRSYLEYAMSVIVGRALPDARDGLKPVHRRILFAMHELGLTADRPFRKCARVVGEVLGKYHPHGDSAVYDALVRLAQDFSMRHPLIQGHGNFGSIDDDPPAAMRYTECRLHALTSTSLLQDLELETVDFADNFDGSQQEPIVLPSRLPQLLLNGSSGIAVGMATNIPPHNLRELVDGLLALIAQPDLSDGELMRYIPGPDFPTGAQIIGREGIRDAYTTGRGSITLRGVATTETLEQPGRQDREAIIITELPYQTNKAALIEKIAELVNDKQLEGIADIRDESDRDGMRIVIELRRDAYPRVVLNNLYKQTPLQSTFGVHMLALVNGDPETLSLKRMLQVFLEFRVECITRRTRHQLQKAQERDHILQGLLVALTHLDLVIQQIRQAADAATARTQLMENHGLTEPQADAILQMQLRRLTALEAEKIEQEHLNLQAQIAELEAVLAHRERILEIIAQELGQLKETFANQRRTRIEHSEQDLEDQDLIANEKSLIILTEQGYIKRLALSTFSAQNRGTRGKAAAQMKEDDGVGHFLTCCDHDYLLFFTDQGVAYCLRAYQIPASSRTSRGVPIVQMLPIPREEKVTSMVAVREFSASEYLVMLTAGGYLKKTALAAFSRVRASGLIAINLRPGDQLRWVRRATEEDSLIIGTRQGMAIHFRADQEQLRPLGRDTQGVKAMDLKPGDQLIGLDVLPAQVVAHLPSSDGDEDQLEESAAPGVDQSEEEVNGENGPWVLVVTTGGYGKRVPVGRFRLQNRAGKGLQALKFRSPGDQVATLRVVQAGEEIMVVTNRGIMIRQSVDDIPCQSRQTRGVCLQKLDDHIPPSVDPEEE